MWTWVCLKYQTQYNVIYCCCRCYFLAPKPATKVYTHGEPPTDGRSQIKSVHLSFANYPRPRLYQLQRLLRLSFAGCPTHPARTTFGDRWIQQGSPAGRFFPRRAVALRTMCSNLGSAKTGPERRMRHRKEMDRFLAGLTNQVTT